MLVWLEDQLKKGSAKGRQFILSGHIFPGISLRKKLDGNWFTNYTEAYAQLCLKYRENIIAEVFAHDHIGDIRLGGNLSQPASNFQLNRRLLINPGVTSNSYSNPGYGFFQIGFNDDLPQAQALKWVFLPLYLTQNDT